MKAEGTLTLTVFVAIVPFLGPITNHIGTGFNDIRLKKVEIQYALSTLAVVLLT